MSVPLEGVCLCVRTWLSSTLFISTFNGVGLRKAHECEYADPGSIFLVCVPPFLSLGVCASKSDYDFYMTL